MLQKNIADVPEKKLKQSLHECNLFDEVFQNSHFAENTRVFSTPSDIFDVPFHTASKVSVFGVILVRIFPHSDLMRRDTPYLSIFSPNTGNTDQNNSKHGHFLCSAIFVEHGVEHWVKLG